MATIKQVQYLCSLVLQHPDFRKSMHWDTWEAEEPDIVGWLNKKYADRFLVAPITKLEAMNHEEISALITHLQNRPTMKDYLAGKDDGL